MRVLCVANGLLPSHRSRCQRRNDTTLTMIAQLGNWSWGDLCICTVIDHIGHLARNISIGSQMYIVVASICQSDRFRRESLEVRDVDLQ
jgi:hypothetical protein